MAEDVRRRVTAEGGEARGASLFGGSKPCHYDMKPFLFMNLPGSLCMARKHSIKTISDALQHGEGIFFVLKLFDCVKGIGIDPSIKEA